jgi:hypothetical protein
MNVAQNFHFTNYNSFLSFTNYNLIYSLSLICRIILNILMSNVTIELGISGYIVFRQVLNETNVPLEVPHV